MINVNQVVKKWCAMTPKTRTSLVSRRIVASALLKKDVGIRTSGSWTSSQCSRCSMLLRAEGKVKCVLICLKGRLVGDCDLCCFPCPQLPQLPKRPERCCADKELDIFDLLMSVNPLVARPISAAGSRQNAWCVHDYKCT
jgi:hypothetical protein